jgi:hypothetical protein
MNDLPQRICRDAGRTAAEITACDIPSLRLTPGTSGSPAGGDATAWSGSSRHRPGRPAASRSKLEPALAPRANSLATLPSSLGYTSWSIRSCAGHLAA